MGSQHVDPAGLYWRKHRLITPAGYVMTEQEAAQAVAAQSAAAHVHPPAQQSRAHENSSECQTCADCGLAPEQQDRAPDNSIKSLPEGLGTGMPDSSSAGRFEGNLACSTPSTMQPLLIEDAAALTHDRAAAILRQLARECDRVATADRPDTAFLDADDPVSESRHTNTASASGAGSAAAIAALEVGVTASMSVPASSHLLPVNRHADELELDSSWHLPPACTCPSVQQEPSHNEAPAATPSMQPAMAYADSPEAVSHTQDVLELASPACAPLLTDSMAWSEADNFCQAGSKVQSCLPAADAPAPVSAAPSVHHKAAAVSPFLQRLQRSKQAACSCSPPAAGPGLAAMQSKHTPHPLAVHFPLP